MSSRIRARELRLGRSFQRIVLSVVSATPLAGALACSTAPDGARQPTGTAAIDGGIDATVSAAVDASADAGVDGTVVVDSASGASPAACDSIPFDGAAIEGDQDGCVTYRALPCGLPPTARREGCFVDLATCIGICGCDPSEGGFFIYCQLSSVSCDDAGNVLDAASIVEFVSCNGISGRRPRGLAPPRVPRRTPLGDYFAASAHLESASVGAFRDLEGSLEAFGAPPRLSRAAGRSADDERGHARAMGRLARRFGGRTARPRTRRVSPPTLLQLLEDDAVEGCVKETFGALLATWQASQARDARVRRTMRRIAHDETRHAALAWEILVWGMLRLPREDRRRVEETLENALAALESAPPLPVHPAVHEVAGHPPPEHERGLMAAFARLVRASLSARDRP
jgi:hypothetical protein